MNDVNQPDIWALYRLMFRSRVFEEAVARLWRAGQISGEMHLNMGEEAIMAGSISQLIDGDALALTLEAGIPVKFARVCTRDTIPYARRLEDQTLPNVPCIVEAALNLARKQRSESESRP